MPHFHVHVPHIPPAPPQTHFQIPDLSKHIKKVRPWVSPKARLRITIGSTILSFLIVCGNWGLKGPVIPGMALSGSGTLVPHTSLTVPISGLYCESLILSREAWDNSEASYAWDTFLYVLPETPSHYERYDFTIFNDNVVLGTKLSWYMRYFHLHSGSSYSLNSCVMEVETQDQIRVCVTQGKKNYNDWVSGNRICRGYLYEVNACTQVENITLPSEYIVVEDSTYYFIHYVLPGNHGEVRVKMNISVSSLDYGVNTSSSNACAYCNVSGIPFSFRGLAIILVGTMDKPNNTNLWSYEDTIEVSWHCDGSLTAYIVIFCIPILSLFGCCNLCNLSLAVYRHYNCHNCSRRRASSTVSLPSPSTGPPVDYTSQQPQSPSSREQVASSQIVQDSHPSVGDHSSTPTREALLKKLKFGIKVYFVVVLIGFTNLALIFTFLEGILPVLIYAPGGSFVLSPGETRVFTVNRFICSSLSIDTVGSSRLSASLFIMDAGSNLTEYSNKTIEGEVTCEGRCYISWRSFMHRGSTIRLGAR